MNHPSSPARPAGEADRLDLRRLLPLFLVVTLHATAAGAVLPVLPFHLRALGASPLVFGIALGAEALSQFLSAPILGRMSDRIGRKPVLLASQLLAAASLLLLALAQEVAMVVLARLLFGCTTGSVAAAIASAAESSSGANRRQAIGLVNAAVALGALLGAGLSGPLSDVALTAPIWLAVALAAAAASLTALCLPAGTAAGGASAAPVSDTPPGAPPLPLRSIFRMPVIRLLVAVMLCHFFAYGLYSSQLPNHLAERFSWNGQPIGAREFSRLVMVDGLIGIAVQLFLLGWLGRRLSERGMILMIAGLVSTGFLAAGLASTLPELALAILCVSTADALAKPTYLAALSVHVPAGQQGAVIGAAQALVALADVTAPVLAGAILGLGLHGLWIGSCIAVALAGALLALTRLPRAAPERSPAEGTMPVGATPADRQERCPAAGDV